MALTPGTLIGSNIFLETRLGEGAMGEVWVAENRSLQSKVAVKVLHRGRQDNDEALTRFQQEARAVASIDSPHVVKIFDFGMTPDGEPYIVMELLKGRDLRELIEHSGTLTPGTTVTVVQQLCRALGRAHELGVIHRDIKPANVFVLDSDGEPFVKVLDFGIARFTTEAQLNMTETGAVMGTPYYMSPEQFVDPRRIDPRSDLWSVAVVAYGCLLGTLPFLGETIGALSLAVHSGSFSPPSRENPSLPVALDAFFQRALSVSPDQRYGSAREFADAFVAACGSVPSSQAPHLTLSNPPPQPFSNAQVLAPPPTVDDLQPMLQSTAGPTPLQGAPSAAPTPHAFTGAPQPKKASRSPLLWVGIVLAVVGLGSLAVAIGALSTADDRRTARSDGDDQVDGDESGKKKRGKKKKKKGKKKKSAAADGEDTEGQSEGGTDPTAEPTVETPPSASAAPEPSSPPSAVAPTPVAPPPATPKPAPVRYAYTGTACFAYKNKSCPSREDCCGPRVGGGPRDVPQYRAPKPGKDRGSCACMRPVCGPGENWSTHKCIIR